MKTRKPLCQAVTAVAALTALALTACAPDEDSAGFEDGEQAGQAEEENGENDAEETEGDDGPEENEATSEDAEDVSGDEDEESPAEEDDTGSSAAQSIDRSHEDALETYSYEIPDEDIDGELEVGVHPIEVDGEVMMLTMSFLAEYDERDTYTFNELHGHGGEPNIANPDAHLNPRLIDRVNFNAYSVLNHDTSRPTSINSYSWWSQPVHEVQMHSGEPFFYWAYYAVPQDDVDSIDVVVNNTGLSHLDIPVFQDVEIQR
ncbi:hypothetical protein [Nesterenkonia muleiensis]|uniref:hypothetical protein n=1 Tax=Nesterenkonia muleiensis TaxID=2282648 RepID=UPI000E74ADD1|nr:hypothetical protein [Nesterenkonia muleiensis]